MTIKASHYGISVQQFWRLEAFAIFSTNHQSSQKKRKALSPSSRKKKNMAVECHKLVSDAEKRHPRNGHRRGTKAWSGMMSDRGRQPGTTNELTALELIQ